MNVLPIEKQILNASMLCEGSNIRGIERVTGVHRDTIMRLGIRLSEKKLTNLYYATALHFFYVNFIKIHSSLRVTPAMKARATNHLWAWEDFLKN